MIKQQIPNPPGGQLKCERGQMPIVDVDHSTNEVYASCNSAPPGKGPNDNNPTAFKNWALGLILNEKRDSRRKLSDRDEVLLYKGQYEFIDLDGTKFTRLFKLPEMVTSEDPSGFEENQKEKDVGGQSSAASG